MTAHVCTGVVNLMHIICSTARKTPALRRGEPLR